MRRTGGIQRASAAGGDRERRGRRCEGRVGLCRLLIGENIRTSSQTYDEPTCSFAHSVWLLLQYGVNRTAEFGCCLDSGEKHATLASSHYSNVKPFQQVLMFLLFFFFKCFHFDFFFLNCHFFFSLLIFTVI